MNAPFLFSERAKFHFDAQQGGVVCAGLVHEFAKAVQEQPCDSHGESAHEHDRPADGTEALRDERNAGDDAGDDAELESASINVISMSNDLLNGLTASDYADQIKQTYNSMDGYTVTNDKEDKFAGKDAYIVDVTGEIGSQKVLLNQIITSDNGNLVVITYGASENAYSKLSDEFKTVLDSFELK